MTQGPGPTPPARRAAPRATRPRSERALFVGPGLLYLTLFFLVPLAIIVSYAFLERGRFGGMQCHEFTLDNFARALEPTSSPGPAAPRSASRSITTLLALLLGYPTAWAIARLPRRWRTVALVLVVLPFWTNFLVRTYAWIVLLNSQGPLNGALMGLGSSMSRCAAVHPGGRRRRAALCLPAADDPAAVCVHRAAGPGAAGCRANLGATRLRAFLTVTLPLTLPGVLIGSIFVFVPEHGQLRHPGAARRRQAGHGRQPHPRPVPQGAQLAVRVRPRAPVVGFAGPAVVVQARLARSTTVVPDA